MYSGFIPPSDELGFGEMHDLLSTEEDEPVRQRAEALCSVAEELVRKVKDVRIFHSTEHIPKSCNK